MLLKIKVYKHSLVCLYKWRRTLIYNAIYVAMIQINILSLFYTTVLVVEKKTCVKVV